MSNPPLTCVVSVSGIRGRIGHDLSAAQVLALSAAYGRMVANGGTVIVGRDSRPTGAMLADAVSAGLRAVGCTVVDIGVVPTPTVPVMIGHLGASGGIQISASHNPVEWNALKFFNAVGRNVDQQQLDRVMAAYRTPPTDLWKTWADVGGASARPDACQIHLERVLAAVDVPLIRAAKLRVVIDSVNGSGANLGPQLLAALGCEVVPLYSRPDLVFPRDPEPTAANVTLTGAVVKATGSALGFVQDPDADRLAIIDAEGTYIGEEYTLVLCALSRLAAAHAAGQRELVVCTNLSTSRMLEDVAARFGAKVVRSKVGEANVVDAMEANHALLGGEGNGGVIDPRVVICRDSHLGMALVLEYLAREKTTLAAVLAGIPRYAMHKEKVAMDRAAVTAAIDRLRSHPLVQGAEIDARDGLKLVWPDRWVHLRASGTEPASRVISEAPTAAEATALATQVREAVGATVITGH